MSNPLGLGELSYEAEPDPSLLQPELVVLLSPPRSFSSVVCAMLGEHPQLYGLAETQLFGAETVGEWWELCSRATFPMSHGLLRGVAELVFGTQNAFTVKQAAVWLRRRSEAGTADVVRELTRCVAPLILVEKSPAVVYDIASMQRILRAFPRTRFIHLTRHPRGYGESVAKHLRESAKVGVVPQWLLNLGSWSGPEFDPQWSWLALNANIQQFLEAVPESQWLRVRGEDMLAEPDRVLPEIATWLRLEADAEAIDAMKHPERSPFASFGPPGARFGNDVFFLRRPALRPGRAQVGDLDAPLSWRGDAGCFSPEVKELARAFGYE